MFPAKSAQPKRIASCESSPPGIRKIPVIDTLENRQREQKYNR